jgi:hypothetical protein
MGVPVNNPGSNRENCPKISTACVIWQGPDIPCIDLCAGDAIDEVVFKLATYLCELSENIFDINNIEFACLLPPDAQRKDTPTNLEELIQLIINYVCNGSVTPLLAARTVGVTSSNEPIIELPDGIAYFDENGDYITVLEQSKYIKVAATKLAETILLINTTQGRIFNAEKAIKNLENDFAKTSKASTNDIYVVSQCASSGTPGQQILIQDAFTVFERNYCNLTSILGTTASLYRGINSQIPNLPNLPQLMNSSLQMKAIPKWSYPVNDIGSSISNLWLTIGDMRSKIIEISKTTYNVPCILLSPENAILGTVNQYGGEVYWEKPSIDNVKIPTSYSIEVFDIDDVDFKSIIFSKTTLEKGTANTCKIISNDIKANREYVIRISAIYECGISNPISLKGVLITQEAYFDMVASIVTSEGAVQNCTDESGKTEYTPILTTISFSAINKITKRQAINEGTQPIMIIVNFESASCDIPETKLIEQGQFQIMPGQAVSNEYVFTSQKLILCQNGRCGEYIKEYVCGVFISDPTIEFESKYNNC